MHSSDRKMNEKLKALIAAVLFLAAVIVFSIVVFFPYGKVWSKENHYDTLFLGASRVYKGIQPNIMDEELGCNSYSMASDSATLEDRYRLLESAMEQGTLNTVVLELSFDALTPIYSSEGDGYVYEVEPLSKLEGFKRKIIFCNEKFNFWEDNYDNVYPALISFGFERWERLIRHRPEEKGYVPYGPIDHRLSRDEAIDTYNSRTINTNYQDEKKEYVDRIIELCLQNNMRIVIINTPDSEAKLWQCEGWEVFESYLNEVAAKYDIEMYDFNLYKDRQRLFDDADCYNDYTHLSDIGSVSFSYLLADVMKRGETEDLSGLFYDSYEEAKTHLIYNDY